MNTSKFTGTWQLAATTTAKSEVGFIDDQRVVLDVKGWLNGSGAALTDQATPTSGLTLTIGASSTFTEHKTAEPGGDWYDNEGVLNTTAEPFDGTLTFDKDCAYLIPNEIPSWAQPTPKRYGTTALRYDDGDTKICDRIEIHAGQLLRTVNVVTDELYLDRVVLVYQQA